MTNKKSTKYEKHVQKKKKNCVKFTCIKMYDTYINIY
jgi:hypothetical protein